MRGLTGAALLAAARTLIADPVDGPVGHAHTGRAVSTAYYALFAELAAMGADTLVSADARNERAWRQAYRAIEHAAARRALIVAAAATQDVDLKIIADGFATLQEDRHGADYDPGATFTRGEASARIELASRALDAIGRLAPPLRRDLATRILLRSRTAS